MKVTSILFYIITVCTLSGYSQSQIAEVINASGGTAQASRYSIEWSIGELTLVNEMDAPDSSYILTNGFVQPIGGTLVQPPLPQPPFSFSNVEIINTNNIRIFPNPVQDILEIDFLQNMEGKMSVLLYDPLGHIVYTNETSTYGFGFTEKINMNGFAKGMYVLYIKKLNKVSGRYELVSNSYKIIKL